MSHSLHTNKQYKYWLENYLTYLRYTNIKKEREIEQNPGYIAKLDFAQQSDLNNSGKPRDTAHLEPQSGKGPR